MTRGSEILKLRQGMWEKVSARLHYPLKIYPFGAGSDEVFLYGKVDYTLKDGKKTTVDWSARAHFAKVDGELLMDFYQVYLVRLALSNCFVECCKTNAKQDTAAMARAK